MIEKRHENQTAKIIPDPINDSSPLNQIARNIQLIPSPDQTFHDFSTSRSAHSQVLSSSETSFYKCSDIMK